MEQKNNSQVSEFILCEFSVEPEMQLLLFMIFLSIYLITVLGNLLIILAVSSDPHLHTPMYFFLSNLSFVDICFTSTTVPKMLVNIQAQNKVISYAGCLTQMFFFVDFTTLDGLLLTAMAYDRFVAICHPLHYVIIMNPRLCVQMVLGCWALSSLTSLLHSLMMLRLSFCTDLEIHNYFCDLKQLIQLACSDTFHNNAAMFFASLLLGGSSLLGILYSYTKIFSSVRRIASAQGRYKAFSTCASHLSVVSLFYCTALGVYLSPAGTHSNSRAQATASIMYTVLTPMLSPFIYSLRNKDIKRALGVLLMMGTTKG